MVKPGSLHSQLHKDSKSVPGSFGGQAAGTGIFSQGITVTLNFSFHTIRNRNMYSQASSMN